MEEHKLRGNVAPDHAFYVLPQLADRGVDTLTTSDVLAVLTPLWTDKHPTAMRVLQRISAVCRWAIAEGHRADDPTVNVTSVLPKGDGAEKHHEAMPYRDVGAFLSRLRAGVVPQAARLALEFLILTVARTNEVRLMRWDKVDVNGRTWTVPAIRMKMSREHRVPLSDRAMTILDAARTLRDHGSDWVFSGSGGAAMSPVALLRATRNVGEASATPHGMRSAFRDWCSEQTDAPHAVIEAALAHVVRNKAKAAYARSDLFERRRTLMQQWRGSPMRFVVLRRWGWNPNGADSARSCAAARVRSARNAVSVSSRMRTAPTSATHRAKCSGSNPMTILRTWWTRRTRRPTQRFARDLRNLTLASPRVNRHEKSGKDATEWVPVRNRC